MAQVRVTLTGSTVTSVPLDAPTTRVTVSIATPDASNHEVYATCNGETPVIPTLGVEVADTQKMVPGGLGMGSTLYPRLYGDHMVIPTVQLISNGTPTVVVSW